MQNGSNSKLKKEKPEIHRFDEMKFFHHLMRYQHSIRSRPGKPFDLLARAKTRLLHG